MSVFTPTATGYVLGEVRDRLGLAPGKAELLRWGENATYRLLDYPYVVRIARPHPGDAAARQQLQAQTRWSHWLNACGFPATRLAEIAPEVLQVDIYPVTVWDYVPRAPEPVQWSETASVLRELHALSPPRNIGLRDVNPFERVGRRLAAPPLHVPDLHLNVLKTEMLRLQQEYAVLEPVLEPGPIHGDAYPGNFLRAATGAILLTDFDEVAWGMRELDLIPLVSAQLNSGDLTPAEYKVWAADYGFDLRSWPGWRVLHDIRCLTSTTWLMQLVDDNPEARAEFYQRVTDIRTKTPNRSWRSF